MLISGLTTVVLYPALALGQVAGEPEAFGPPADPAAIEACDAAGCVLPVSPVQHEAVCRMIEAQTFWALPREQRGVIAEKLAELGEPIPGVQSPEELAEISPALAARAVPLTDKELEEAWKAVEPFTTREAFERFSPIHQRMLANFTELVMQEDWTPALPCFTPGVDGELIMAFEEIVSYGLSSLDENDPMRFEQTGRWTATALTPTGQGIQGDPVTLTYSFPPDGAFIPSSVGEPAGNNDLNAFLDGIYGGDRAFWRGLYDEIFARWGELSGVTYVLETNDDGASLALANAGIAGVRGDLRMFGKPIDGNSGTLAFNFFPQNGDMVIDTADSFYSNTNNNSLALRNVLWHEHGHGMGQLHTCPITQSKLMEPFISLAFEGPQFDDILNAQRHYGDPFEPNQGILTATPIGSFAAGSTLSITGVSLDDNADRDNYSFTATEPIAFDVTLTPLGFLYQAGPQTENCNELQPYNPLLFLNPILTIFEDAGGSFPIVAEINANPAGGAESTRVSLDAGDYIIVASAISPTGDEIIAYEIDISAEFDALEISAPSPLPTLLEPGAATFVEVAIEANQEALVGQPELLYRLAGDPQFTSLAPTGNEGNLWQFMLPPFLCGDSPEYLISATGSVSQAVLFPESGPLNSFVGNSSTSTISFEDNGATDLGYTVSGNAADGQWALGAPTAFVRGNPNADFDGNNSAWLTDPDPAGENSDVDDGETILTSPPVDLIGGSTISYAYWFNDIANGELNGGDSLKVQISNDNGLTYTTVREYTTAQGTWRTDVLVAGVDYLPSPLGEGRVRFIASDLIANDTATQNVVEAGVDAIVITGPECVNPPTLGCSGADLSTTGATLQGQQGFGVPDGVIDGDDLSFFLNFWAASDASVGDVTTTGATIAGQQGFGVPDGNVDGDDLGFFLNLWIPGCP